PAIDPVRRGLLLVKIGGLVNMPAEDLQATLKKLAGQNRSAYRPPQTPPPGPSVPPAGLQQGEEHHEGGDVVVEEEAPVRLEIRTLKGQDAAEGWLLGAQLVEPPLFG